MQEGAPALRSWKRTSCTDRLSLCYFEIMKCALESAKVVRLAAMILMLSFTMASGAFIETFSNGGDDGNWHLTDNPDRLLRIESGGGNPGAYLHGQVFTPRAGLVRAAGDFTYPFLGQLLRAKDR